MNIKKIAQMYAEEIKFLTKEFIVEIYDELNSLLATLPDEDIRNCLIKGADEITFSMDGSIEFYSTTREKSIQEHQVDMTKITSFRGMYVVSYIDVKLQANLLEFGLDQDVLSKESEDFAEKYLTCIKDSLGDNCTIKDDGFCIPLQYFE